MIDEGVTLLRGFAATAALRVEIATLVAAAPLRHLTTPGGGRMSVGMTNAGAVGWHSDRRGYRYVTADPLTGLSWPPIPATLQGLAAAAAAAGGFAGFCPDCCLINRYDIGALMGTHRDHDEADMSHPIVSVSIGLPAVFLWYGATRKGPPRPVPVSDGDVLVWGGPARGGYHAVRRVKAQQDDAYDCRYNLTFRRAR